MSGEPSDHDLLTRIDGVGRTTANDLLAHFGSGYEVATAACHGWAALMHVDGFGEQRARGFFDDMNEAGVYDELRRGRGVRE